MRFDKNAMIDIGFGARMPAQGSKFRGVTVGQGEWDRGGFSVTAFHVGAFSEVIRRFRQERG